jgi:predicted nucleotidyltransferase
MSVPTRDAGEGAIVNAIQRSLGPLPVLLWGSRANGGAEQGSDYDIFVVVPTHRLPHAAGRLGALSRALEEQLGVHVSLSPLPRMMLQLRVRRLSLWKLSRESRVLSGPAGFSLNRTPPPVLTDRGRVSYAMSAVLYLIEALEPACLGKGSLPPDVQRGLQKALLHVAQLRMLRKGGYASRLEQALIELDDPLLTSLAERLELADTWYALRVQLLAELAGSKRRDGPLRALVVNAQYAGLALLSRSPNWRAGIGLKAVDARLADAAVHLLLAVRPDGLVDQLQVDAARHSLPRPLRRPGGTGWEQLRDFLLREWPRAHPLVGL